mgnify:CR=1 FL=1
MNVIDAINILKKYERYNDAQNECKRKKIDEAPYDMQGHHKIYCRYLSQIWGELRNKKETLLKVKCSEFDNIPDNPKPVHSDCYSVSLGCTREYCKTKCKYYQENIAPLVQEMNEICEAEKVLKETAERDYQLR